MVKEWLSRELEEPGKRMIKQRVDPLCHTERSGTAVKNILHEVSKLAMRPLVWQPCVPRDGICLQKNGVF